MRDRRTRAARRYHDWNGVSRSSATAHRLEEILEELRQLRFRLDAQPAEPRTADTRTDASPGAPLIPDLCNPLPPYAKGHDDEKAFQPIWFDA